MRTDCNCELMYHDLSSQHQTIQMLAASESLLKIYPVFFVEYDRKTTVLKVAAVSSETILF